MAFWRNRAMSTAEVGAGHRQQGPVTEVGKVGGTGHLQHGVCVQGSTESWGDKLGTLEAFSGQEKDVTVPQ